MRSMDKKQRNTPIARLLIGLTMGYTILLIYWMLYGFGRIPYGEYRINVIPFQTIQAYILNFDQYRLTSWLISFGGNILVFVPYGVIISYYSNRGYWHFLLIFLSGLAVLELAQLVTRRGVWDIDDFILNSLGASIGYVSYTARRRCLHKWL